MGGRSKARGGGAVHGFRLAWACIQKFDRDKGFFLAAALAFSILLSVIPLSLLLLTILGARLSSDADIAEHLGKYFQTLTPAFDREAVRSLLGVVRHRRIAGGIGIAGLVWTSTMVFSSLRLSLNVIFGVERSRSTLRAFAVDVLMIFLCGIMLLASMFLTSWISVMQRLGERLLPEIGPLAAFVLKYPLPLVFTVLMCFMVYKIAPNRQMPVVPCLKAALLTGLLWEIAKQFFGWYVLHLGRYSLVYGSLSTAAIFVLWVYYSAIIFLVGAEVACLLEWQPQELRTRVRSRRSFFPE